MAVETFVGTITVPTTGTPPVASTATGLPFQPKLLLFYSASTGTFDATNTNIRDVVGAARTTSEQFAIANASDGAGAAAGNTGRVSRFGTECICVPSNGNPAIDALATFVQFNSDGFQVNWTDVASVASTEVGYFALGGADITNISIQQVTPNSTTNGTTQAITFGFTPDCVLFFSPAVPSTTGIADANQCYGVATRTTAQQYTTFWFENDAALNMDCALYSTNQRCHSQPGATSVKDADASLTSWDATGVTITWNDAVAATTARVYAIGIKGGVWGVNQVLIPNSTGSVQYNTATPMTVKGLMGFGTTDPTDTDTTVSVASGDATSYIGFCDSGLRQGNVSEIQTNANATSVCQRRQSKTKFSTWMTGTTGTLVSDGAVTALGGSSFTINWTTAGAGTRRFAALTIGETPVSLIWEDRRLRVRTPRMTANPGLSHGRR